MNIQERLNNLKSKEVRVVSAPQLFPTPPELAERMVDMADIEPDQLILEPSAGTGNLLVPLSVNWRDGATSCQRLNIVAIEVNAGLCSNLRKEFPLVEVICNDFLDYDQGLKFDRIIMNPPFINGEDIKHILHAKEMLKPGGILVAICAGGPRQKDKLEPISSYWEPLPADTFKSQGTSVNSVLLTIEA